MNLSENNIKSFYLTKKLLQIILEVELPEQVYNSNAIENSILTIKETERVLLEMETDRHLSLREVFEAKNLPICRWQWKNRESFNKPSITKKWISTNNY